MVMPIAGNDALATAVAGVFGIDGLDTWDPSFIGTADRRDGRGRDRPRLLRQGRPGDNRPDGVPVHDYDRLIHIDSTVTPRWLPISWRISLGVGGPDHRRRAVERFGNDERVDR